MNKKIITTIIFILLIIFVYNNEHATQNNQINSEHQNTNQLDQKQKVTLDRVVDGDTLVVFIDGESERVRLIGVDSPESVKENTPVECFGNESADYLEKLLSDNENIFLEYDEAAGKHDKYGRLLAHVFLADNTNVNRKIIHNGYAYEYSYQGQSYLHKNEYKDAEKFAKENKKGLWSLDSCNGIK
jgi:micrococcal nuclease